MVIFFTLLNYNFNPIFIVLVFNDGSARELVNLAGTVPVCYKSIRFKTIFFNNIMHFIFNFTDVTYHIPVCIWIMDTHPQNAPICYVRPTPEMHIKVSMYVDYNGKIYLPYLHDWQPVF